LCIAWFHNTVTSPSSYTGLGMCLYHFSVVSIPKALHICIIIINCNWVLGVMFVVLWCTPIVMCCIHQGHNADRTYLRCCPARAWNRLLCLQGVMEGCWLCSVTFADFHW
jgi:hypothetical protein